MEKVPQYKTNKLKQANEQTNKTTSTFKKKKSIPRFFIFSFKSLAFGETEAP